MSMECSLLQSQSYAKSGGVKRKMRGTNLNPTRAKEVSEIPSKIDKVANLYFTMTVAG
jgi:hypothetical protein